METNKFKNIPGGDPSRRPPITTISWSCRGCHEEFSRDTRSPKGFNPPKSCSKRCEDLQFEPAAREIIRRRFNCEIPNIENRGIFRTIVRYDALINAAAKSKTSVTKRTYLCPQCGQNQEHYQIGKAPFDRKAYYCSALCARSAQAKKPVGVVCKNSFKRSYPTQKEAAVAAQSANDALVADGEELMTEYLCTCEEWHFGHASKAKSEDEFLLIYAELKNVLKEILS